jgi:hypothetical protein
MKAAQLASIFAPASTPAKAIVDLSMFVLGITAVIFIVVSTANRPKCTAARRLSWRGRSCPS